MSQCQENNEARRKIDGTEIALVLIYSQGIGRMAKGKPLTPKQREMTKHLLKGRSRVKSYQLAGYTGKDPHQGAQQVIEQVREKMPDLMDRLGLTDEVLLRKYLNPLLNAKETKFAQSEGRFTDEREVVAWGPRERGLEMAFKLKGSYAVAPAADTTNVGVQVIILNSPRPERPALDVPANGSNGSNGHKPSE